MRLTLTLCNDESSDPGHRHLHAGRHRAVYVHSGIGAWHLLKDVLAVLSSGTAGEAHTEYCVLDTSAELTHGLIVSTAYQNRLRKMFQILGLRAEATRHAASRETISTVWQ